MPPDVAAGTGTFVEQFTSLVELHGLSMLFLLTILETCFVTGFFIPSGVATSAATVLALRGHLSLPSVAAVAIAGGCLGDSVGFWIGRWGDERIAEGSGKFAMLYRNKRAAADRIFGRHPFFSVTLARLISFVRTVMPMAAGMSTISYRRFIPYEIAGVTLWAAMYMAIGFGIVGGWQAATSILGLGGAAALGVSVFVVWRFMTRRRARIAIRRSARGVEISRSEESAGDQT
jgi:membrane-associated protein